MTIVDHIANNLQSVPVTDFCQHLPSVRNGITVVAVVALAALGVWLCRRQLESREALPGVVSAQIAAPILVTRVQIAEGEPWAGAVLTRDTIAVVLSFLSPRDLVKTTRVNRSFWHLGRAELERRCNLLPKGTICARDEFKDYLQRLGEEGGDIAEPRLAPNEALGRLLEDVEMRRHRVLHWVPGRFSSRDREGNPMEYPLDLLTLRAMANRRGERTSSSLWLDGDVSDQCGTVTVGEGSWVLTEPLPATSVGKPFDELAEEIVRCSQKLLLPIEAMAIQHQRWVLFEDDMCGMLPHHWYGNFALCGAKVTDLYGQEWWVLAGGRGASGFQVHDYWNDHNDYVGASPSWKF